MSQLNLFILIMDSFSYHTPIQIHVLFTKIELDAYILL